MASSSSVVPMKQRQPASPSPAPEPSTSNRTAYDLAAIDLQTGQVDPEIIDAVFKDLKTLLVTVEKLQKLRQEVGDVRDLVLRLLDGELLEGAELEQLKVSANSLAKLAHLYGDYQTALASAQPARQLLEHIMP